MAGQVLVTVPTSDACKILSVKRESDRMISEGSVIARVQKKATGEVISVNAPITGTIEKACVKVGDYIQDYGEIVTMSPCRHSIVIKDLCAECGADLQGTNSVTSASISIVHHVPELRVTASEATNIGKEDRHRLLRDKKLVLLVDLDHTLVHTTELDVDPNLPGVHHYQLWGREWYHTKIRPHIKQFLTKVHELFELHVFTFGARLYAHTVTRLLDPEAKFFEHRIVSRDELFNPATKMGNVKALFPCGDEMVCIIDDRLDVWDHAMNLIHVKPYIFFKEAGFIDAKCEANNKEKQSEESQNGREVQNDSGDTAENDDAASKTDSANGKSKSVDEASNNETEKREKLETKKEEGAAEMPEEKAQEVSKEGTPESTKDAAVLESTEETTQNANEKDSVEKEEKPANVDDDGEEEEEEEVADEYLLHLEDILVRIHKRYFELYDQRDQSDTNDIPNLKAIIPQLRSKVLEGAVIVFTGVIPTNTGQDVQLKHPAYVTARSLGAQISNNLSKNSTTHLVAASLDTEKVRQARRMGGNMKIVCLDWLWSCVERWEWVDERLFPLVEESMNKLNKKGVWRGSHKTYTESLEAGEDSGTDCGTPRETGSDSVEAGEIDELVGTGAMIDVQMKEEMMDELEEYLASDSEDSENNEESSQQPPPVLHRVTNDDDSDSSSSQESLSGCSHPKGWKSDKRKVNDEDSDSVGKHSSLKRLCRPSDLDAPEGDSNNSADASYEESVGSVDEEMADALEKELADRA